MLIGVRYAIMASMIMVIYEYVFSYIFDVCIFHIGVLVGSTIV